MTSIDIHHSDVASAVKTGFAKVPKRLPSWLFYDETGDKIFQAIMQMPGYYLTSCEYGILSTYKEILRQHFAKGSSSFHLVELGAGDGVKTEVLLRHFVKNNATFHYSPIDVSETVLNQLQERFHKSIPELPITAVCSRYDEALEELRNHRNERKVLMFLGANIGNFTLEDAILFVRKLSAAMCAGDQLLIGFDLKKDPRLIQAAYDDPFGITRKFNMNLLVRLNRELGAQFNLNKFDHYPFYDPETGVTKSFLISLKDQNIFIEAFGHCVHFDQWEVIQTEISQKYSNLMIRKIAEQAGLKILQCFYDVKEYFCDVLFVK